LKALVNGDRLSLRQPEGQATLDARLDYSSERLRLLYVGITRARRELIITYNTGRRGNCHKSLPLQALSRIQEGHNGN
jgi:DNA helicase-2/ATP-dependent DNA helicase PcrA